MRRQCLRLALYLKTHTKGTTMAGCEYTKSKNSILKTLGCCSKLTWWCCRSSCGSSKGWACSASSSWQASSWSWTSCGKAAHQINRFTSQSMNFKRFTNTNDHGFDSYHFRCRRSNTSRSTSLKTKENPNQFQSFTESPHGPVDWASYVLSWAEAHLHSQTLQPTNPICVVSFSLRETFFIFLENIF